MFFPKLASFYSEEEQKLIAIDMLVKQFLPDSPFFSTTLNLGDRCYSPLHIDGQNLVFGICCIAVFGTFDHRLEGHNLMSPSRTIFELRQGDIFFLPSGSVEHGNIPVEKSGTRFVAVLYTAGGLFRWIDQGHRTAADGEGAQERGPIPDEEKHLTAGK